MDVTRALAPHVERARALADSLLVNAQCVIRQPGDGWVFDPDTGTSIPTTAPVVYEGPCQFHPASQVAGVRETLAGEITVAPGYYVLGVPHTVTGVRYGATATITLTDDPETTATVRVLSYNIDSVTLTRRRFLCELLHDQPEQE